MASARKMKLLGKTIGWRVYLSHEESHDVASQAPTVSSILKKAGVTPKAGVPMKLSSAGFNAACKLGKHRGTKLIITLVPPGVAFR
jgi:arginine decarboxylase-like protein